MAVVFFEPTGDGHVRLLAGLTVLERRIREAATQGATGAVVAAAPVAFPRALPIPVASRSSRASSWSTTPPGGGPSGR